MSQETATEPRKRRSLRLDNYDYSQAGAYFVTVCAQDRACLFGSVMDDAMALNDMGRIVDETWRAMPRHFPQVRLDEFVIMPNHVHGIVWIVADRRGVACNAPPGTIPKNTVPAGPKHARMSEISPKPGTLAAIVRSFKSAASKRINEYRRTGNPPIWQRNYHEHVIRNEKALDAIRQYIANNPLQWAMDHENPTATPDAIRMGMNDLARILHATP